MHPDLRARAVQRRTRDDACVMPPLTTCALAIFAGHRGRPWLAQCRMAQPGHDHTECRPAREGGHDPRSVVPVLVLRTYVRVERVSERALIARPRIPRASLTDPVCSRSDPLLHHDGAPPVSRQPGHPERLRGRSQRPEGDDGDAPQDEARRLFDSHGREFTCRTCAATKLSLTTTRCGLAGQVARRSLAPA